MHQQPEHPRCAICGTPDQPLDGFGQCKAHGQCDRRFQARTQESRPSTPDSETGQQSGLGDMPRPEH